MSESKRETARKPSGLERLLEKLANDRRGAFRKAAKQYSQMSKSRKNPVAKNDSARRASSDGIAAALNCGAYSRIPSDFVFTTPKSSIEGAPAAAVPFGEMQNAKRKTKNGKWNFTRGTLF